MTSDPTLAAIWSADFEECLVLDVWASEAGLW